MAEPNFDTLFTSALSVLKAVDIQAQVAANIPRPLRNTVNFSVELSGYKAWFLRIEKSSLSLLQVARLIYMRHNGALLVGEVDGLVAVITSRTCTAVHAISSGVQFENTALALVSEADHVWPEAIKRITRFSFIFELCRSHGWITIGTDMLTLSISDIISTPFRYGEKPHRNVPVLSILETETTEIVLKMQVNKYYPLSIGEMIASREPNFNVVVLPGLSEGLCSLHHKANKWDGDNLKKYWKTHHGYTLPDESVAKTVGVSLPSSGFELTYPITCVWKHKWIYLPSHTREYLPRMEARLIHEFESIAGAWSEASGIGINVDRNGLLWLQHAARERQLVNPEKTLILPKPPTHSRAKRRRN